MFAERLGELRFTRFVGNSFPAQLHLLIKLTFWQLAGVSVHILYVDDSGTVDDPNERFFVLAAVSVFERGLYHQIKAVDNCVAEFGMGGDPHEIELHASTMYHGRDGIWRFRCALGSFGVMLAIGFGPTSREPRSAASKRRLASGLLYSDDCFAMAETISIGFDSPITRFSEVGRCIYCRAMRYSGAEIRPLSDEHIIAEGLSGTLVLPRASCRRCAKATTKIEGNVLRTVLWAPRTLLKMRTKRPKERPTSFTTMAKIGGKDVKIELPIADYPTMLFFPRFGPPGILVGRARDRADMRAFWIYQMNLSAANLAKYGIQSVAGPVMDMQRFSQMLAKIAHSYAIATLGLDSFSPLLLDHILRSGEYPCHFVGGSDEDGDSPKTNSLHELDHAERTENGTRYLVVRVRLFAHLGAPDYFVATGVVPKAA